MYKEELALAKQLAIDAGKKVMGIYTEENFEVQYKEDNSPLTKADLVANNIIVNGITTHYPEDGILTEEAVNDKERLNKSRVWIIDPVDGTKEFLKRNGEFTINIALAVDRKPLIGVVYAPVIDELYTADIEEAHLEKNGKQTKLSTSTTSDIKKMVVARSRSHASPQLLELIEKAGFTNTIVAGSSLKGCLVASGQADAYFRLGQINEWDICAMNAVLNASGAILTDLEGNELKYNNDKTLFAGVIASNNTIHSELIALQNNREEKEKQDE